MNNISGFGPVVYINDKEVNNENIKISDDKIEIAIQTLKSESLGLAKARNQIGLPIKKESSITKDQLDRLTNAIAETELEMALSAENLDKKRKLLTKSAKLGNGDACYHLGKFSKKHDGEIPAFKYWKKGANKEHPGCLYKLGKSYCEGMGTKENFKKSQSCLIAAGEAGIEKAKTYFIENFLQNIGIEDFPTVIGWLLEMEKKENISSAEKAKIHKDLGRLYVVQGRKAEEEFDFKYAIEAFSEAKLFWPGAESELQRVLDKKQCIFEGISEESRPSAEMDFQKIYNRLTFKSSYRDKFIKYYRESELDHRFGNVLCPKETSVNLQNYSIKIHANHVKLETFQFIATQYPYGYGQNYFAEMCKDSLIIDLTQSRERISQEYYPSIGRPRKFQVGNEVAELSCTEEKELDDEIDFYSYSYKKIQEEKSFNIHRLHYTDWPDHHVISIEKCEKLIKIILDFIDEGKKEGKGFENIVIHCKAGIGRSIVLGEAINLFEGVRQRVVTKENLINKINQDILEIRRCRGVNCINLEQYKFLYQFGEKLLNSITAEI